MPALAGDGCVCVCECVWQPAAEAACARVGGVRATQPAAHTHNSDGQRRRPTKALGEAVCVCPVHSASDASCLSAKDLVIAPRRMPVECNAAKCVHSRVKRAMRLCDAPRRIYAWESPKMLRIPRPTTLTYDSPPPLTILEHRPPSAHMRPMTLHRNYLRFLNPPSPLTHSTPPHIRFDAKSIRDSENQFRFP